MKGYTTGKMYLIEIEKITVSDSQPRSHFDEQAMGELTASIKRLGVLQPILVQSGQDGKFALVAGERRYRAAQAAGLTTIPAVLTDGDPGEIGIVENLLREDLTAIEEAEALDALKTTHNYQLNDLCAIFGLSASTLSEILSLTKLPAAVKDDCRNDRKAARSILVEIAKQRSEAKMQTLYDKYKLKGLTRGELRSTPRAAKPATDGPPDVAFVGNFHQRLDGLDITKVAQEQHGALIEALEKIRLTTLQKLKDLKAAAATTSS